MTLIEMLFFVLDFNIMLYFITPRIIIFICYDFLVNMYLFIVIVVFYENNNNKHSIISFL